MTTCPVNPLPSSDLTNSLKVKLADCIVFVTISIYSGVQVARRGIAPSGTES